MSLPAVRYTAAYMHARLSLSSPDLITLRSRRRHLSREVTRPNYRQRAEGILLSLLLLLRSTKGAQIKYAGGIPPPLLPPFFSFLPFFFWAIGLGRKEDIRRAIFLTRGERKEERFLSFLLCLFVPGQRVDDD